MTQTTSAVRRPAHGSDRLLNIVKTLMIAPLLFALAACGGQSTADRLGRQDAKYALEVLDRAPDVDALVCASDLMAIGAIRALQRRGVRVPDDVAVLGWDGIVDGEYVTPSLTTVAPDLPALADATLDALIRRIEGDRTPGQAYVVPHRLVVRGSTGGV